MSDSNFIYTLTHKNEKEGIQSGFRLYDIENCISSIQTEVKGKQGNFMSYHLQSVQVGC